MDSTLKQHPWQKHYPKVVPKEIDPDIYPSLLEFFDLYFKKFKDLPALENMGKSLTYAEFDQLSRDFAAFLQGSGLKKGDRIALQMPNTLQYPIALTGALRAGLIVVNINPLYTAREMDHQIKDSGAKAIVILENFCDKLEKIVSNTDLKMVMVTKLGDMLGGLKGSIVNLVVKHVKKMVPSYHLPGALSFKDCMKKGRNMSYQKPELNNQDIAFLQYTGGTTGLSKGAILTHRNIIANTEQSISWSKPRLEEGKEIYITALPLYHIYALTINFFCPIAIGAHNILITNPRDMKGFLKEISKHPFTTFSGINTLYNGMMTHSDLKKVDFSHVKIACAGGMALQTSVAKRWNEMTGTEIAEGYGLTETSPLLTSNVFEGAVRLGTIGIPVPSTEIRIVDEQEQEVAIGERGEICARGPQVFPGYWHKEEESKKCFTRDGEWFKTGDIGVMDEDGFIRIVDRKKDMILVSGFNVYPNEVEEVVASHPKVLEVAAIGVPDTKSTEVVKLFIVKKDASLTEEEIKNFCKENLTNYKRPRIVTFCDELPKSNVGKILRRKLRDQETQGVA